MAFISPTSMLATVLCAWWSEPSLLLPTKAKAARDDTPRRYHDFAPEPVAIKESIPVEKLKCVSIPPRYERKLGDGELSYYLPSRADGVNDMYVHVGFRAASERMTRARVRIVWAILRARHPLLSAKVEMHDYDDVRFVFTPPSSELHALSDADTNMDYRTQSKEELLESYLNGPRTLSDSRLSYLILSQKAGEASLPTPPATPSEVDYPVSYESSEILYEYDLLLCATHYIGDGMAEHAFTNEIFELLGDDLTYTDLEVMLSDELERRRQSTHKQAALPVCLEDRLPDGQGRLYQTVSQMTFRSFQEKSIGGHTFPRRANKQRRTRLCTVSFDKERSKRIAKVCQRRGVSVSAALFSICNVAWARLPDTKPELPMMMYSALNLRPYFSKPCTNDSYWFLAIGYFNVTLPVLLPRSCTAPQTFWLRARSAMEQGFRAAFNPLLAAHTREMGMERATRSKTWAREDDERDRAMKCEPAPSTWVPPTPPATPQCASPPLPPKPKPKAKPPSARAPSAALMGLSLLGNLDVTYAHSKYTSLELHTLTTGARQRQGGMLLMSYTFSSKLWITFAYDDLGFESDVVEGFWSNALAAVDEFLLEQ